MFSKFNHRVVVAMIAATLFMSNNISYGAFHKLSGTVQAQNVVTASASVVASNASSHNKAGMINSAWSGLNANQQTTLALIKDDWAKMTESQRQKWLIIANKAAQTTPEEQAKIQERIKVWHSLTPQQRMAVRDNFTNTSKKSSEEKASKWQAYQQLSGEEKQKLAQTPIKKTLTVIQPESKKGTVLEPIKKVSASAGNQASQ